MRFPLIAIALAALITTGCTTTEKVTNTLALNDLFNQAGMAERAGRDDEALDLWSQYLTRRPHDARVRYRYGALLLKHGRATEAADNLWVAHDLRPGNLVYLETLAEALHQGGERDTMFQLLNDTIEEGGLAAGHLRLAKFSLRTGLVDEAEESIRIAAAILGDDNSEPYRMLADLHRQTGDTDQEIEALRTLLWFNPRNEAANNRLRELGQIPGPSLAIQPTLGD